MPNNSMLVPTTSTGVKSTCNFFNVEWLNDLPDYTYYALWLRWPDFDLPRGHKLYVLSFHLETVDVDWVTRQAEILDAPIILLSDLNYYSYNFPSNVFAYTYYYWNHQIDLIKRWFPQTKTKNLKYKASAICNRVTQSKLIIVTALLEIMPNESLVTLNDWVEEKNVHYGQKTGFAEIDRLTDIFWNKYHGRISRFDDFDNRTDNVQMITANPWTSPYQDCVVNFTNESFHYSYMCTNGKEYIYPGPFLTEKTLKCLVGGTPFIAVGQFDTYRTLANLGFKFEYGLDLSWDRDSGNLSRLTSILHLIKDLQSYSIDALYRLTDDSTQHNFDHIWSGKFDIECLKHNHEVVQKILSKHC